MITSSSVCLLCSPIADVSRDVRCCHDERRTDFDPSHHADLTLFYLSQGVGSAIGGGIWSNLVPGKMREYISDPAIAAKAYSNPISLISKYAPGTEVRDAMARAQGETQHVLSITGTCLAAVGLCTAMFIQWLKLTDEQSLAQVEEAEVGKLKENATDKVEGK